MELRLDHVLVAVADLDEGARRLASDPGLTALPGGRHPGVGTANMIVPLGTDYIELIAIVDDAEAGTLPRSARVRDAVRRGETFAGWAVRTDELDALTARLQAAGISCAAPLDGSRLRPDGVLLRWRTLMLAEPEPADPFFIEWHIAPGEHPAQRRVAHSSGATGIAAVIAGGAQTPTGRILREAGIAVDYDALLVPGILAIELDTPGGRRRIS